MAQPLPIVLLSHVHQEATMSGTAGEAAAGAFGSARRAVHSTLGTHRELWLGGLGFLALTGAVFAYQFASIAADAAGPRRADLRWEYLALLGLCLPVETVTSALRLWLISRVLSPRLGFWTCVKAEWANVAISVLTPSQSGGGPGQMYVLCRGGATAGTALTVSLLSFVGTMAGLLAMGFYAVLSGRIAAAGPLFLAAVWSLIAIAGGMAVAAVCPRAVRRLLEAAARVAGRAGAGDRPRRLAVRLADMADAYRADLVRFLREGRLHFLAVCALSLVFLAARCTLPFLCARFLGLDGGSFREIVETQMALVFLYFFAPTPGGAGVAETASLSIMAGVVPAGYAPYYNLLWRFSTAYLAAIAGLVCLAHAALSDLRRAARGA
jgi:uncharacterized protein (TIRG00374 family)